MAGRKKLDKRDLLIASKSREFTDEGLKILMGIARAAEKDSDRVAAIKELFDRGWGKAAQPIIGDDDKPIKMEISWSK
jgi:hypothetical protein